MTTTGNILFSTAKLQKTLMHRMLIVNCYLRFVV